jgi:voltage-gated potassium channel
VTDQLTDHYIICGLGRVGREVLLELRRHKRAVCAVDVDESALIGHDSLAHVAGDATDDTVLLRAGVAPARGLVATTGDDAINLSIVLSARALNANLVIVARASHAAAEPKLLRAGASRVVCPYAIGGHRMATQLVAPGVTAFVDALRGEEHLNLWIEEATIAAGSSLVGRAIGDALPRKSPQISLIALRRAAERRFVTNPSPEVRLATGDILIAVGEEESLRHLVALATTGRSPELTLPRGSMSDA